MPVPGPICAVEIKSLAMTSKTILAMATIFKLPPHLWGYLPEEVSCVSKVASYVPKKLPLDKQGGVTPTQSFV